MAAGLLLVAVVVQVSWREFRFLTSREPGVKEGTVRMVNPAFSGEGKDGKQYLVTAVSGVRDAADPQLFLLQAPVVTVSGGGESPARTVAKRGLFNQDNLTLKLEGDVSTEQDGRNVFLADNTVIDTATGAISGSGFQSTRGSGQVRADNYTITDSGDRVVFKGGVRARLDAR